LITEDYPKTSFQVRVPLAVQSEIIVDLHMQAPVENMYCCPACNTCLEIPDGHAVTCDGCNLHVKVKGKVLTIAGERLPTTEDAA